MGTQLVTPVTCCCSSIYHYDNEIVLNHSPRPRRFRGSPANPTIGSKTGRETAQKFLPGPANGQRWIQRRSKTAPRVWIQREPVRKEQCQSLLEQQRVALAAAAQDKLNSAR